VAASSQIGFRFFGNFLGYKISFVRAAIAHPQSRMLAFLLAAFGRARTEKPSLRSSQLSSLPAAIKQAPPAVACRAAIERQETRLWKRAFCWRWILLSTAAV
jgi:hypothetical protein